MSRRKALRKSQTVERLLIVAYVCDQLCSAHRAKSKQYRSRALWAWTRQLGLRSAVRSFRLWRLCGLKLAGRCGGAHLRVTPWHRTGIALIKFTPTLLAYRPRNHELRRSSGLHLFRVKVCLRTAKNILWFVLSDCPCTTCRPSVLYNVACVMMTSLMSRLLCFRYLFCWSVIITYVVSRHETRR